MIFHFLFAFFVSSAAYSNADAGQSNADAGQSRLEKAKMINKALFKGRLGFFKTLAHNVKSKVKRQVSLTTKSVAPCAVSGSPIESFFRCLVSKGALSYGLSAGAIMQLMVKVSNENPRWAGRACAAMCAVGPRSLPMDTKSGKTSDKHAVFARGVSSLVAKGMSTTATPPEGYIPLFEQTVGEVAVQERENKEAFCSLADGGDAPGGDAESSEEIGQLVVSAVSAAGLLDQSTLIYYDQAHRAETHPGAPGAAAPSPAGPADNPDDTQGTMIILAKDLAQFVKAFCSFVCNTNQRLRNQWFEKIGRFAKYEIAEGCFYENQAEASEVTADRPWWDQRVIQQHAATKLAISNSTAQLRRSGSLGGGIGGGFANAGLGVLDGSTNFENTNSGFDATTLAGGAESPFGSTVNSAGLLTGASQFGY